MAYKIIIDADACPKTVLAMAQTVGSEWGVEVWTVASFNHQIKSLHHITVGNSSQEADIQIMNLVNRGDIVITQDWGLAAMVLAKGAGAISPWGKIFREETIDFLLEEREAKAKHRRAGGRTKGPRKRTTGDDMQFESQLKGVLHEQMEKVKKQP